LFQADCNPDQGQSKQIREKRTNLAEPLPKALVDLKIIYVPGEVEERETQPLQSSCFYGHCMNLLIQQPFIEGEWYARLQSTEEKRKKEAD
jgi:hypothetical protein